MHLGTSKQGHKPMHVQNLTGDRPLVTAGRVADTFWARLRGLIGSDGLGPEEGLLIVPCNSIHTHFMRFPIDVLYVSSEGEVVAIDHALPPWRFGRIHRRARSVLELSAGRAKDTNTQVGDRLQVDGCKV